VVPPMARRNVVDTVTSEDLQAHRVYRVCKVRKASQVHRGIAVRWAMMDLGARLVNRDHPDPRGTVGTRGKQVKVAG
jgi:hypothetical protein